MSSPSDSHGEIDGRPATWFYQRAEKDQEGRLSWAEGRVTCEYVTLQRIASWMMACSTSVQVCS
jgi:hypothetical protein